MPTFTLPGNKNIVFRFFERVETDHSDRLVQETGMVVGGRLHTVITGVGSPVVAALSNARSNDITGPIVHKHGEDKPEDSTTDTQSEDESEDSSPSEDTEGETSATSVTPEVLDSDEKTSVDSTTEPEAQTRVETEAERIQREGDEAMDDADDGTGHTYS